MVIVVVLDTEQISFRFINSISTQNTQHNVCGGSKTQNIYHQKVGGILCLEQCPETLHEKGHDDRIRIESH